jgi:hypothetical protein
MLVATMLWQVISWFTLICDAALLVLAIRLFRQRRSRSSALLMWACISFVIGASSWFTFGFGRGFFFRHTDAAAKATILRWSERTEFTFQLVSVVLMILAVLSLFREHHV